MSHDYALLGYVLFALCLSPFLILIAICVPMRYRALVVTAVVGLIIYTQIDHRAWEDRPVTETRYLDLSKIETSPALCKHEPTPEEQGAGLDYLKVGRANQIIEDERLKRTIVHAPVFTGGTPRLTACWYKETIAYYEQQLALTAPVYTPQAGCALEPTALERLRGC